MSMSILSVGSKPRHAAHEVGELNEAAAPTQLALGPARRPVARSLATPAAAQGAGAQGEGREASHGHQ